MCDSCNPRLRLLTCLARNTAAPAEVLLRLLETGDSDVHMALGGRAELPDAVLEAILAHPDGTVRHALACNLRIGPEVRSRLAADPDPRIRAAVVERSYSRRYEAAPGARALLTVEAYERLAADPDVFVREEVADQACTPGHVRALLARDPSPTVRRLLVYRWRQLTGEVRAALLDDPIGYHVDPEAMFRPLAWVLALCDDARAMRECALSAHPALRRSAAWCPHLPPDLTDRLAGDEDFVVRLFLAENHPDPPGSLLLRTVLEFEGYSVGRMLDHPNFPCDGLRRFAGSAVPRERELVAMDPGAPAGVIERLSHDGDPGVRSAMAHDPRLPTARLLALLAEPETAGAAVTNPALPVSAMVQIMDDAATG